MALASDVTPYGIAAMNPAVSSDETEGAVKKVLLTSSSKTFLSRNKYLLTDKGFLLFTAASGQEAIKLHQESLFDLILSDLELDDMDGCSLCSEVRRTESSRAVPVVLICHDTAECVEKVEQSNAAALLLRPIDPTQLLVTIGSFIDMQLARCKRVVFTAEVATRKQEIEFICVSHDISATGILLETEQQLSIGDRISCAFSVYDSARTWTEGEVTRSISSPASRNFYGIKFINLPVSQCNEIKKYVSLNDHLGIRLAFNPSRSRYGSALLPIGTDTFCRD